MTRIYGITGTIFCIDMKCSSGYIASAYQKEAVIESLFTVHTGFTRCSNSKCNLVFQTHIKNIFSDADFLCPHCRQKLLACHIVQCSNCQSIVDFLALGEGGESIVFYVRKCHRCNGTVEDERKLQLFYFPDQML